MKTVVIVCFEKLFLSSSEQDASFRVSARPFAPSPLPYSVMKTGAKVENAATPPPVGLEDKRERLVYGPPHVSPVNRSSAVTFSCKEVSCMVEVRWCSSGTLRFRLNVLNAEEHEEGTVLCFNVVLFEGVHQKHRTFCSSRKRSGSYFSTVAEFPPGINADVFHLSVMRITPQFMRAQSSLWLERKVISFVSLSRRTAKTNFVSREQRLLLIETS